MNLNEIEAKCFIMALFIRDDGLRFLLGSGAYEFKDSQLMFAGNTIENDVVSVQGNDGYMLAGQVRRPNTQVFDGYIGDASVSKSEVEGYRRDFMAFFQKNHFYTVVYVMADGSAIQRRRGFLVDAPTSQELWQMYPEYHVALNFEDVNYYKYSENDDGEETYGKSADIGLAKVQYGGLIWDNNSEIEISSTGTNITLAGTMEGGAIESVELNGDTEQTTYSGKNLLFCRDTYTANGVNTVLQSDGSIVCTGSTTASWGYNWRPYQAALAKVIPAGTYTFSRSGTTTGTISYVLYDSAKNQIVMFKLASGNTSITVTTTVDAYYDSGSVGEIGETGTAVDSHYYLQLESGSTPTSFEPYVGGTASPNPDYPQEVQTVTGEQTVTVMDSTQGKNIWKLPPSTSTVNNVKYTPNEDGTFDLVGLASADTEFSTIMRADTLGIKEGETYTLSSNGSNILYFVFNCDANGTWKKTLMSFSPNNSSVSSTCPSLVDSYVRLVIRVSNGANINQTNIKSMLEKGNQATPFVPYAIQTYPVNLGKNLFDIDQYTNAVTRGSTLVSLTKTSDTTLRTTNLYASTNNYCAIPIPDASRLLGHTITMSCDVSLTNVTAAKAAIFWKTTTNTVGTQIGDTLSITTGGSKTLSFSVPDSFPSGTNGIFCAIYGSDSAQPADSYVDWSNIQIERGSTATTYAPYIQAFGKNLANIPDCNVTDTNYSVSVTSGLIEVNSTTVNKAFDLCGSSISGNWLPTSSNANDYHLTPNGGTWALSASDISGTISGTQNLYISVFTSKTSKNMYVYSDMTSTPITLTLADDEYIKSIYLWCGSNTTYTSVKFKLQLEKGSTATTYEPNISGQLELCKISTYQDYIYKSGEDWYVHKEVRHLSLAVSDMDSSSDQYPGWSNISVFNNDIGAGTNGDLARVTSYVSNVTLPNSTSTTETRIAYNTRTPYEIIMMLKGNTTQTQWKSQYPNLTLELYYGILNTPTDTQITNATLISELEDLLSATTYSGTTYITVSGDLASPLEIKVIAIGGGGVVWDENGAEWEAGGGGEIVIVNVDSIENILPVWTIRGEAENPTLTNLTTGMSITYNGTVASGQTLVIDLLNKTAKLNGTSVISDVSGQWVEFKPGNNRVSYSTENANAPDSTIEWQEVVG